MDTAAEARWLRCGGVFGGGGYGGGGASAAVKTSGLGRYEKAGWDGDIADIAP